MKHRHLIALLQEGYTTIQVVFNDDVRGRSKPYTYKAPLSAGVEVGDRVVVDSPSNGLVVVEVVGTDKAPRIDLDADFTYKWIVQKVELKAYEEQLEREAKAMDALQEVERDAAELMSLALRAKVEQMERQEPVGTTHAMPGASAFTMACFNASDVPVGTKLYTLPGAQQCKNCNGMGDRFDPSGEKIPCDLCEKIYTLPGAQPAPRVPEDVMRDVEWKRELFIIKHAMAMNSWDWKSEASNDMKREAYAAVVKLLAAAPEAKP